MTASRHHDAPAAIGEMCQSHLEIIDPNALKCLEILLAETATQYGIGIFSGGQYYKRLVADVVSDSCLLRADSDFTKLAGSGFQVLRLEDQIGTVVAAPLRPKHEATNAQVHNKKGIPF